MALVSWDPEKVKSLGSISVFLGHLGVILPWGTGHNPTINKYTLCVSPHYQGIRSWCQGAVERVKLVGKGGYCNPLLRRLKGRVGLKRPVVWEHQVWKSLPYNLAYPSPKLQLQTTLRLESIDSSKAQRDGLGGGTSTGRLNTIGNMAIAPRVDYITQCLF